MKKYSIFVLISSQAVLMENCLHRYCFHVNMHLGSLFSICSNAAIANHTYMQTLL